MKHIYVGTLALQQRPELAQLVALCISTWSRAELNMALCMGEIIGAHSEAAVAVFQSLRNARAQREAISAAANAALSGEVLDVTEAVISVYSSTSKQRHDLAHGQFGCSSELPDALLWAESSKHAKYMIDQSLKIKNGISEQFYSDEMRGYLFVYTKNDLNETLTNI